jgi:hypothetical protein
MPGTCVLALVRAERDMQRAKAQLADRLTEYNHLRAAKAWKGLRDAKMAAGRVRSIISENGFSCSELTAALRRSKAVDGHQPIAISPFEWSNPRKRIPPSPFLTVVCRLVLALLSSHFPCHSHVIPIMFRLSPFII